MAVSEYSFGDGDPGLDPGLMEPAPAGAEPKWFRDRMDKVSEQVNALVEENNRLKAAQSRSQVADALKAKGFDPAAAGLYTGTPDKLDDWLTAHGGALARTTAPEGGASEEQQAPSGPPASTVPADSQGQMQRMMEQGTQGVAPPQGSEKELAAAIAAAKTPEEFAQIMKAHGSQFHWDQ